MEHEAMVLRKQNYDRAGDIATSVSNFAFRSAAKFQPSFVRHGL